MAVPECIEERRRTQGGPIVVHVWHLVAGPADKEATWRPIVCGQGIVFPGPAHDREPTCPDCISAAPPRKDDDAAH